MKEDQNVKY